jgi:hypothetical protein
MIVGTRTARAAEHYCVTGRALEARAESWIIPIT